MDGADALLPGTPAATVIADKAYDAQERVIDSLLDNGKYVVVPPKRCRKQPRDYDKHLYRAPHLIEQFFNKLKQYRSIATRYDKIAPNFLGAIHLVAAVVWIN